jgi:hypothetical protein
MLEERNDIDLNELAPYFITDKFYTRDMILAELIDWQKSEPDFLVLIHGNIDGFLIAHRVRNTLWIHQCWHKNESDLTIAQDAIDYARQWAKDRGMNTITFETNRSKSRAWKRLGFREYTVNYMMEV